MATEPTLEIRAAAILLAKLLFTRLPGRPLAELTAALALALGGLLSAFPPDQRPLLRDGVVQQLDDAIEVMCASDAEAAGAVEAG